MIFKIYYAEAVSRVFFKSFFFGNLSLIILAFYGLISNAGISATFSGALFILVASLLSLSKRFRSSPLAVLFCFFTFLNLSIPLAFILFEGDGYIAGSSIGLAPFEQDIYRGSRSLGILYLTVCWVAVWLGIVTIKSKIIKLDRSIFSSIRSNSIVLLGILVAIVTLYDNEALILVRTDGVNKVTSLLAFIFFDHAYLIFAGLAFFFKIAEYKNNPLKENIENKLGLIFLIFLTVSFLGGSKGALLVIFLLLVFYPYSLTSQYRGASVIFPRPKYLLLFAILAPSLFYLALVKRVFIANGVNLDLSALLTIASEIELDQFYDLIRQIFYRLCSAGFDQFLLLFQSFIVNSWDFETAGKFVIYLTKNTLNLLLPGTPFQEAYAPTSQIFPQVLQKEIIDLELDAISLIAAYNTQAYTLFGVCMVIFGIGAPVIVYLIILIFSYAYKRLDNILLRSAMLYFIGGALSSYGLDAVIGNSVHLLVSLLLINFMLKSSAQFERFIRSAIGSQSCSN